MTRCPCPTPDVHGNPFRYCPNCNWVEVPEPKPEPLPTVGRIVHYTSYGTPGGEYGSECRAAIVTAVGDRFKNEGIDLAVLNPTGMFFNQNVMKDGNPTRESGRLGGTWHWPERADGS